MDEELSNGKKQSWIHYSFEDSNIISKELMDIVLLERGKILNIFATKLGIYPSSIHQLSLDDTYDSEPFDTYFKFSEDSALLLCTSTILQKGEWILNDAYLYEGMMFTILLMYKIGEEEKIVSDYISIFGLEGEKIEEILKILTDKFDIIEIEDNSDDDAFWQTKLSWKVMNINDTIYSRPSNRYKQLSGINNNNNSEPNIFHEYVMTLKDMRITYSDPDSPNYIRISCPVDNSNSFEELLVKLKIPKPQVRRRQKVVNYRWEARVDVNVVADLVRRLEEVKDGSW